MNDKICAVVVTYNRHELLKECIEALRKQTRKLDEIIVINNDSDDGTKEWLDEQSEITKIHQENLGGAGGFHNGMKLAYENDYDWIWLMDDDCLPTSDSLEVLIAARKEKIVVLNSIVVGKGAANMLSFGLEDEKLKKYYRSPSELNSINVVVGANFFNGTLISKKIIAQIGLPFKEFVIYGDELEYYLRIKNAGFEVLTITNSTVLHPVQKHKYIGKGKLFYKLIWFNKLGVEYVPRNLMAICFFYKEFTVRRLIKTFVFDLYGLITIQKSIIFFCKYIRSISKGPKLIRELQTQKKIVLYKFYQDD